MKESDIRPADIFRKYLRLSEIDGRSFFSDKSVFVHRACPGCGRDDPRPAFGKFNFDLAFCSECGTLYVNPVPSQDDLDAFYRDSISQRYWARVFFPSVAEARRERIFRPRVERLKDVVAAHGASPRKIIDVGAGAGIFLEEARALGLGTELAAVEPNTEMAETLSAKGFETFHGFAVAAAADPALASSADLVVSFEVIEHVTDPRGYVTDISRLVRPGGLVVVSGLCGDGFDIAVLGPHSRSVSPPHHLNFLSREGVAAMVAEAGLELLSFMTPGVLDLDIVRNALTDDPDLPVDRFIRHLVLAAPDDTRAEFQKLITDSGLSSHMWFVLRRPDAPR